MRGVVRVLLFCAVALTAAAPAERLKIGFGHVPPISSRDANGQATGFAVDVLNEAARREGVELSWRGAGTSRETERDLRSGALDLVPAGMVTPERKGFLYVSEPWWFAELSLVAPAASGVASPADLRGKRLALSTPIFSSLVAQQFPALTQVPFSDPRRAIEAVCAGQADAALISHSELHESFAQRPKACRDATLQSVDTSLAIELAVIANPGRERIARRLRRQIDEMALDGTLAALAARHPPVPTSGAVQLAAALRSRYELRTFRTALVAALGLLVLSVLYLAARRRAQRALALSELRYRAFFQHAAVGAAEADPHTGRFLNVNDTFSGMLGYTRNELLGKTSAEVTWPDDLSADLDKYARLIRGDAPTVSSEKRYVRRDGSLVWAHVEVAAVRDASGNLLYTTAVIKDISEQKRSEEALRHSEERYRMLVEANPVGVIFASISGPDRGRIYHVNQAYADMVGYAREEIESGRVRWTDITPQEWLKADERAIEEALLHGRSRLYEKEYLRKDGTRVPILVACGAVGKSGEAVAFVLDVSDRKRLEKEVKWLAGLLPICASCKRVRDENGRWEQLEVYMNSRISADFTHGLCPNCLPLYVDAAVVDSGP